MAKRKKQLSLKEKMLHLLRQRRVWAAGLSALAALLGSLGHWQAVELLSLLAGSLALHSYVKPKKK